MSELARLQARFFALLAQPDDPAVAAEKLASGNDPAVLPLAGWLRGADDAAVLARFAVYADGYFLRLCEALRQTYPRLARLADARADRGFDHVAAAYFVAHPPRAYSLRRVGTRLPEHLRASSDLEAPALADLAELERARDDAFFAAEHEPVTAEHLARVAPDAWPSLRFALAPCVRVLELASGARALELFEMGSPTGPEASPPGPLSFTGEGEESADPSPPLLQRRGGLGGEACLLVSRRHFTPVHRVLAPGEADALARLRDGATFGEACEAFVDDDAHESARRAFEALRSWLADGVLVAR